MQESGVDLEFDILNDIVGNLQPKDGFYELQSRPLDDVISQPPTRNFGTGADAILTELLKPKDYKMSMSRTQQKLQLQREHLLKQEQKKKEQERLRQLEQTSEISIPFTRHPETLPSHIPPAVLKFKTKLENPTKYYVYKTQERKLKEYINQHGSTPSPGFTPPTSQPTLNAINNMNVMPFVGDGLGMAGAMKPPDSPMSAASSTEPSEVDEIIDDIISLEGDNAVANQMGLDHNFEFFDFSATNAPLPLPAPASISDIYSGRNVSSGSLPDAISSSCPPKIKQEPNESCSNMQKFDHVSYLKDRQKKDNHNMIERRRRFNINDRIKELGTMIPKQDMEMKQNKGTILKCTVDYIKHLKKENDRHKANIDKFRETEELNSKLLLRIQELEMHCRAHNVPVTPLTNDVSTATLSSLLASKRTAQPLLTIKPERYCNNESATCSMNMDSSAAEEDGKEYMET